MQNATTPNLGYKKSISQRVIDRVNVTRAQSASSAQTHENIIQATRLACITSPFTGDQNRLNEHLMLGRANLMTCMTAWALYVDIEVLDRIAQKTAKTEQNMPNTPSASP